MCARVSLFGFGGDTDMGGGDGTQPQPFHFWADVSHTEHNLTAKYHNMALEHRYYQQLQTRNSYKQHEQQRTKSAALLGS